MNLPTCFHPITQQKHKDLLDFDKQTGEEQVTQREADWGELGFYKLLIRSWSANNEQLRLIKDLSNSCGEQQLKMIQKPWNTTEEKLPKDYHQNEAAKQNSTIQFSLFSTNSERTSKNRNHFNTILHVSVNNSDQLVY